MTGEDQSADFAQEEAVHDENQESAQEPEQVAYGALRTTAEGFDRVQIRNTGQAGVLPPPAPGPGASAVSHRRGEGRRVNLRRESGGGYSIWMGGQCIQTFCDQWEDITRFQLPAGIQQQVQIRIGVMGEAREWNQQEIRGTPQFDEVEDVREEVEVRGHLTMGDISADVPVGARLRVDRPQPVHNREELVRMFNELPEHNQAIIADQIRSNYDASRPVAEVARTEVTIAMFDDLHREVVQLSTLIRETYR